MKVRGSREKSQCSKRRGLEKNKILVLGRRKRLIKLKARGGKVWREIDSYRKVEDGRFKDAQMTIMGNTGF